MFVSDLRHFLDLAEDAPGPARRMAKQLSLIVRAATAGDTSVEWTTALGCGRRPGRQPCPGYITVQRAEAPRSIEWRCTSCGDEGVISGWEDSPYDIRRRHLVAVPTETRQIVAPAEIGTALRDLQLVDSDSERLIFRAQGSENGIVLVGDDDDFDELLGYIAAEANHEDNRRRQRQLDDAFQLINKAVAAPPLRVVP